MPSSFDPLALVKAMGQQTDPYSWAQMYYQDASKQSSLMKQLQARMLMQEQLLDERSREKEQDRQKAEGIALNNRVGAMERLKYRLANQRAGGGASKDFDLPDGTMTEKEFQVNTALGSKIKKGDYQLIVRGGKAYYIPRKGGVAVPQQAPAKKSAYEDDDEEDE